jgi:hypothetical protein
MKQTSVIKIPTITATKGLKLNSSLLKKDNQDFSFVMAAIKPPNVPKIIIRRALSGNLKKNCI